MTRLPSRLAAGLVFGANAAVLVLEIVGLRLVAPYVGVTLQTSSAVIAVALGAIAYGAWLGGRLADRRDPHDLLVPFLLGAGAASALSLPLVRYVGELLRGTNPIAMLALTLLTLFVPAALLSALTPLIVKLQLGDLRETGRIVGKLSSVGTLGAITATLGTGFVLVAALPTSRIILGLAILLGLCAAIVALYLRSFRRGIGLQALLAIGLIACSGLSLIVPTPCDIETAYHCAKVTRDPARATGRVLWLNSVQQSYVDTANPRHLEFVYTQWIGKLIDSMAPAGVPLDTLHLGGGGLTLPNYLAASRPRSRSLVLELDRDLVELDRAMLGIELGPNSAVRTGDARVELRREPDSSRDLVIGDAFGHLVVPWHLTTQELVRDVRRVLRPTGIYALNLIDWPPARFARAELSTVASVFAQIALVTLPAALRGQAGANFLVLASHAPLPLEALVNALDLLPEPVSLLSGPALHAWIGDAELLTDDYAPVDQLRAIWKAP
jgi:spermidine synthase